MGLVDAAAWTSCGVAVTAASAWGRLRARLSRRPTAEARRVRRELDVEVLMTELNHSPATRRPGPIAYLAGLALYVVLGLTLKTIVVNWIVGPLFPVLLFGVIPAGLRRWSRRTTQRVYR